MERTDEEEELNAPTNSAMQRQQYIEVIEMILSILTSDLSPPVARQQYQGHLFRLLVQLCPHCKWTSPGFE